VDFDTTRPVYSTRPDKCHISHVVADTISWEQKMASSLEDMDEVISYAKNYNLGFSIPYTMNGEEKNYYPDFIVRIKTPSPSALISSPLVGEDKGEGASGELNLIVEVTGEHKKDKAAKVSTANTLWIPAINNHGGFGRWKFIEITDPWNAKNEIRAALRKET
jgi:type III restriction enzyme